jgi:hypothetical protein
MNLNRVELVGGLMRDPETRQAKNGQSFLEVTLAVNGTRFDPTIGEQVVTSTLKTSSGGTEKRTRVYASVCWPTRVHPRVGAEAWQ